MKIDVNNLIVDFLQVSTLAGLSLHKEDIIPETIAEEMFPADRFLSFQIKNRGSEIENIIDNRLGVPESA